MVPRYVHEASDSAVLGVHPAVAAAGTGQDRRYSAYLAREIDDAVCTALRDEPFVLIVGECLAGKSRTAYEAMRSTLPGHRLVVPRDGAHLHALAEAEEFRGDTVVWLDDLERYLGPGGFGLPSLRRLRALAQGHLVVLATLRAGVAGAYRADAGAGALVAREVAGPVRALLDYAAEATFELPAALGDDEPARHEDVDAHLPGTARRRTGQRRLAAHLAGGPRLLAGWHEERHPVGAALVSAAVDARRAGFAGPLSGALLAALLPHYLGGEAPPVDEFADALAWATAPPGDGAAAPLRPMAGGYDVFGYLVDRTEADPEAAPVPDAVWQEILSGAAADVAIGVGWAAYRAGLRDHAAAAWRPHAVPAHPAALTAYGQLLVEDERREEAEQLWRHAAEQGSTQAMELLGRLMSGRLRYPEAEHWWRQAAERGDTAATYNLGRLMEVTMRHGDAEYWLRCAADSGHAEATLALAELSERLGRADQAVEWYERGLDHRLADAMFWLATHRGDVHPADWLTARAAARGHAPAAAVHGFSLFLDGRDAEAEPLLRRAVDQGIPTALVPLCELLSRTGRDAEGERRLRVAAEGGTQVAYAAWADRLAARGRGAEAMRWYGQAADKGDPQAMRKLGLLQWEHGRQADAEQSLRRAAEAHDPQASVELARLLIQRGRADDAESLLLRPHVFVDGSMAYELAELLRSQGRRDRAEGWYRDAITQSHPEAHERLIDIMIEAGRADEAVEHLRRYALFGVARERLVRLLPRTGPTASALDLLRHCATDGKEPDFVRRLVEELTRRHGPRVGAEWTQAAAKVHEYGSRTITVSPELDRRMAALWQDEHDPGRPDPDTDDREER